MVNKNTRAVEVYFFRNKLSIKSMEDVKRYLKRFINA